jgi:hypothetical protein
MEQSPTAALPGLCCADLAQVMQQVRDVICRHESQRGRFSRADTARRFELCSRNVIEHVREIAIVGGPQRHQQGPVGLLRRLQTNATFLVVAGKIQRILQTRSNKTLVIVRCRIDQMPEHLLARLTAGQNWPFRLTVSETTQPALGFIDCEPQLVAYFFHPSIPAGAFYVC